MSSVLAAGLDGGHPDTGFVRYTSFYQELRMQLRAAASAKTRKTKAVSQVDPLSSPLI